MRTRPSDHSSTQEESDFALNSSRLTPQSSDRRTDLSRTAADNAQARRSFTGAKYHASRDSDTLDRRKVERALRNQITTSESSSSSSPPSSSAAAAIDGASSSQEEEDLRRGQDTDDKMELMGMRRHRVRSPWRASPFALSMTLMSLLVGYLIVNSFFTRQLDEKGCQKCYMYPSYARLTDFDTEHTRLASKYSLWLYREQTCQNEDPPVLRGVPVLFITGNAGSYRQVRPLGAESADHFANNIRNDAAKLAAGTRDLDWFSADFNEDFTAFHGQTLLDQAEYLNDAIAYILSLYHDPYRSWRDPGLPDPTSVIVVGHSMGGIVARTMLNMTNYQSNSINTIITMSSPHARAPLPFDSDMVSTYDRINEYWRESHAQRWASDNPLWHVTLVSIAGGSLDNIVPSDYSSIASLVPNTHGFTVFTSSVPNVWTGADHLAILWCDSFRKAIAHAILEVVDVNRPSQTKPRAERMRIFKKWFLTGMESIAEKTLLQQEPSTLLTLEDDANTVLQTGERLTLRQLGGHGEARKTYFLPVPQGAERGEKRFSLLTDQALVKPGMDGGVEVLLCSVSPSSPGHVFKAHRANDVAAGSPSVLTRLACRSAAEDVILLPASRANSKHPFDESAPFSYLQYDLETFAEHQFVAIVDKSGTHSQGFLVAEFTDKWWHSRVQSSMGLHQLLTSGFYTRLSPDRGVMTDINVAAAYSSLLAYRVTIDSEACAAGSPPPMFAPLLRQHISEPFESKFFVNVREAEVTLHGIAPFMPPPMRGHSKMNGLNLQLWTDPSCQAAVEVKLEVDVLGSLGKLWMRYRTVFPALPLLIVAVVLRKQFTTHDKTGTFPTFMEALDVCLRSNIPLLISAMTILAVSFASGFTPGVDTAAVPPSSFSSDPPESPLSPHNDVETWQQNNTEGFLSYTRNDLLLGQADPFFWFLVPLFGFISIGISVLINYLALSLTGLLAGVYNWCSKLSPPPSPSYSAVDARRRQHVGFAVVSPRRRILVTAVLVFSVATVIPYPFAYMVACIVQLATCVRGLRFVQDTRSALSAANFYNYAHSILVLMLWVLPINIPVLVVWVHNLAVTLSPFASHHNIFSILPFILLVEVGTSGKMIPRVKSGIRLVTSIMFFGFAVYCAVYGVTYSYQLHHIANIICAWLVLLHVSQYDLSWERLVQIMTDSNNGYDALAGDDGRLLKKRP